MKAIELFAGAGGLAYGTAEAGLQHTVVLEQDKDACETLHLNHKRGVKHVRDWQILKEDVSEYNFFQHRDVRTCDTRRGRVTCGGRACR
ncbi:MAG: hypothetical protein FJ304_15755 [Planctomycetes bacterium]|nr:hypothetical protein [Planctomycetota bacterium]